MSHHASRLAVAATLSAVLFTGSAFAQTADQVKVDFARAVYQAAGTHVHHDRPQPLLRAVVVLRVRLDENNHWAAEVFRDNPDQPEMTRLALDSVAQLPAPTHLTPKALQALGYSEREALAAVKALPGGVGVREGIKQALKSLNR